MRKNKHPNIVNFVDSYKVDDELWVNIIKFKLIKGCNGVS